MHADIPTAAEIHALVATQQPGCVTIYLPTSPLSQEAQGDRIAFKNQIAEAVAALEAGDVPTHDVRELEESLDALEDDYDFWSVQAHTLAVFATPERLRTFRLPSRLVASVHVAERFHITPLLRAVTFPQAAYVLALSQQSARLVEISADGEPVEVKVPDMPDSVAGHAGKASIADRGAVGRVQGGEGQKLRMRQFARAVDAAARHVIAGHTVPLILASTPPLEPIFRSVNTYPHLAGPGLRTNPEALTPAELMAAEARAVLDGLYADELAALRDTFAVRAAQGRTATDLGDLTRAGEAGAIDTLFVDIDLEDEADAADAVTRLALQGGGRVLAVRADDVPGDGSLAAILRYAA